MQVGEQSMAKTGRVEKAQIELGTGADRRMAEARNTALKFPDSSLAFLTFLNIASPLDIK